MAKQEKDAVVLLLLVTQLTLLLVNIANSLANMPRKSTLINKWSHHTLAQIMLEKQQYSVCNDYAVRICMRMDPLLR